jgi:hypothetical protein
MTPSLYHLYSKIPKAWEVPYEEPPEILERNLIPALKKLEGYNIIFAQGYGKYVFVTLRAMEVPVNELYAIDFAEYFENTFNKDGEYSIQFRKYTLIYNIGKEPAINKNFSAQLLERLLATAEKDGAVVFLISDLSYTDFNKTYGIVTGNRIRLPKHKLDTVL